MNIIYAYDIVEECDSVFAGGNLDVSWRDFVAYLAYEGFMGAPTKGAFFNNNIRISQRSISKTEFELSAALADLKVQIIRSPIIHHCMQYHTNACDHPPRPSSMQL